MRRILHTALAKSGFLIAPVGGVRLLHRPLMLRTVSQCLFSLAEKTQETTVLCSVRNRGAVTLTPWAMGSSISKGPEASSGEANQLFQLYMSIVSNDNREWLSEREG